MGIVPFMQRKCGQRKKKRVKKPVCTRRNGGEKILPAMGKRKREGDYACASPWAPPTQSSSVLPTSKLVKGETKEKKKNLECGGRRQLRKRKKRSAIRRGGKEGGLKEGKVRPEGEKTYLISISTGKPQRNEKVIVFLAKGRPAERGPCRRLRVLPSTCPRGGGGGKDTCPEWVKKIALTRERAARDAQRRKQPEGGVYIHESKKEGKEENGKTTGPREERSWTRS